MNSGVTSIYWYFRSKDELLLALRDRVSHQFYQELPPFGGGPWHEELYQYFAELRNALQKSPTYRGVFAYRIQFLFERAAMRPSVLRRLKAGHFFLAQAGLTLDEATEAINACSNYTSGFVILEHGLDGNRDSNDHGVEGADWSQPVNLNAADLPLISMIGINRRVDLGDDQFESGLRLLIERIRKELTIADHAEQNN